MGLWEIFLLAVTLSMDTLAVSAGGSAAMGRRVPAGRVALIAATFALFQGGFTLLGWAGGKGLYAVVSAFDHWLAFVLLAYIGVKMAYDGINEIRSGGDRPQSGGVSLLSARTLVMSAVATSIDALAVGVTLAVSVRQTDTLLYGVAVITAVTAVAAVVGLLCGKSLGDRFGSWAQVCGGAVLLCIGGKILLEHTLLA